MSPSVSADRKGHVQFEPPASIFEKSRMSLMTASRSRRLYHRAGIALLGGQLVSSISSVMPMMPFMGVRISWLMLARKGSWPGWPLRPLAWPVSVPPRLILPVGFPVPATCCNGGSPGRRPSPPSPAPCTAVGCSRSPARGAVGWARGCPRRSQTARRAGPPDVGPHGDVMVRLIVSRPAGPVNDCPVRCFATAAMSKEPAASTACFQR